MEEERYTLDYSFDVECFTGRLDARRRDQGKRFYGALSMGREDLEGRRTANIQNLRFYGAPQAAFLFMPAIGDSVRAAGDVGMYGQTFLLALAARGLAGIPQTMLGFFAQTVRDVLGINNEFKLLFWISFGFEDLSSPANDVRMPRDSVTETVTFHE